MAFIYLLWDSKSFRHFRSSLSRPSALVPLTLRRTSGNGRAGPLARSPPKKSGTGRIRLIAPRSARRPPGARRSIAEYGHRPALCSPASPPPSAAGTRLDGPRPFFGKETVPEGDEDDFAPRCHRIPTAAGPVTHRSAAPSVSCFPANRSRKGNRNAPTAATVRSGSGHTRRYGPIQ